MTRAALLLVDAHLFADRCDECVAEGSWVSTPKGRTPIEALREGDTIYSVDTASWVLVEVSITEIHSATRESIALELGSCERLRCTPTHPVFDPVSKSYRPAAEWIEGDATRVTQIVEGRARASEVTARSAYAGLARVFDLGVSGPQGNFIVDGMLVKSA